jgi:hypothetical protein
VVHDVRMEESGAAATVPAKANAVLRDGSIQTGPESRAEIRFRDQTVARVGDNTHFGFESRSRRFDLSSGAVLAQVPSGVGRTTLRVHSITATATGTTLAVECLPQAYTKFISLDGTSRLCLKKGRWGNDCVLLRAGQMLIASADPKALPEAVDVDLNRLLETCQFITEFPALPGQDRLIKAAAAQRKSKSHGAFVDTNLVIFGRGTLVSQKTAASSNAKESGAGPATPAPLSSPSPGYNSPTPSP